MKGNPEERAIALGFFWLQELDLNQRPSGYECVPVLFFCFFCALRDFSTLSFPKILTNSFALHPVAQN